MWVKHLSYVGYVSYTKFYPGVVSWKWCKWLFQYKKTIFNARNNYVCVRVLGFEFDGLVPINTIR